VLRYTRRKTNAANDTLTGTNQGAVAIARTSVENDRVDSGTGNVARAVDTILSVTR
jgi:hypothetical protein